MEKYSLNNQKYSVLPFQASYFLSPCHFLPAILLPCPLVSPRNHTKPMKIWLLTSIFLACTWIHPQYLLNFEKIFYHLLGDCQKDISAWNLWVRGCMGQNLICYMNSCKLIDPSWVRDSLCVINLYEYPLSVCGLKGMISLSTIILVDFISLYLHSFSHCVWSIVKWVIPLLTAK